MNRILAIIGAFLLVLGGVTAVFPLATIGNGGGGTTTYQVCVDTGILGIQTYLNGSPFENQCTTYTTTTTVTVSYQVLPNAYPAPCFSHWFWNDKQGTYSSTNPSISVNVNSPAGVIVNALACGASNSVTASSVLPWALGVPGVFLLGLGLVLPAPKRGKLV